MTLPSITNAVLTKVEAPGFSVDYGAAATTGAVKWTGSEDVYWSETTEEVSAGEVEQRRTRDTQDILIHRFVVLRDDLGVAWAVDDVITVVRPVTGTTTAIVKSIAVTSATGLAGVTRLILENV